MVRDAFPLPQIDEALQAVNNCHWLTSFDLAQGYLQMPVAETDIHKMAFRAESSSLYEFTCMPFGLSYSGSSFCCLMEMCIDRPTICDTSVIARQHLCICGQY